MKKYLTLFAATAMLLLMSACAPESSGSGGPAASPTQDGSSVSSDESLPAPAPSCTPVAGGIPSTAKDFECLNLVSTSGSDSTGELGWLGTDPFTVVTMPQDGALHFSSKTPCNTLMGAVEVSDTQFIVGPNLAMTMMGCQSPQSDYEGWVAKFFSAPLDYTLNKDTMVLKNAHGEVTFKSAAS